MISELTEVTEIKKPTSQGRGWIFYDQDCRFCSRIANRLSHAFDRRGFTFAPLQDLWVQRTLGLSPEEALTEMRVLAANGQILGGADAIIFLAGHVWWMSPLSFIARLSPIRALAHRLYRWVAAQRTCARPSQTARAPRTRWWALVVLPTLALLAKPIASFL